MSKDYIEIKGARVNNLKNVDVRLPRNQFIVIAGVSGSGKSSLAFDTLYAEGQRRYVESLSSYARQFLGRMNKPECDFIRGIPPAIAIEQKVIARNPRSTVGTSTEIYEYLRLLFARIGHTFSPVSGEEVKKHSTEDVVQKMLEFSRGTKFVVMAPVVVPEGRTLEQQLKACILQGYSRMMAPVKAHDGSEIIRIEDYLEQLSANKSIEAPSGAVGGATPSGTGGGGLFLVIDRLSADDSKDTIARLVDSAETAFYEGQGQMRLMVMPSGLTYDFSTRFEADASSASTSISSYLTPTSPSTTAASSAGTARRWASGRTGSSSMPPRTTSPSLNLITTSPSDRRTSCGTDCPATAIRTCTKSPASMPSSRW